MALEWDIEKDVRFRQGLEKGLLEGIELAVNVKFGTEGLIVMDKIRNITDINNLEKIKDIILKSENIKELMGMIGAMNN
ncbi:MAG: hypothetical protein HQK96_16690 [Nitrospirae bacterium]|nr:hypothetical protein [Nitrospirota bacterium]